MRFETAPISFAITYTSSTFPQSALRRPLSRHKEIHMSRSSLVALALITSVGTLGNPLLAGDDNDQEIPLTAVIQRAPGVGYGSINSALEDYCDHISYPGSTFGDNIRVMRYELSGQATERQVHGVIQGLVAQGLLLRGEANFTAHEVDGQTGSVWVTDLGATTLAYNNQYAFGRLGFAQAHSRSQGAGVIMAIIDSGVDPTHEAVRGPITAWQWDFVDNDAFPLDAGDGIDNDNDGVIDDGVGHGTYVTSLVRLAAPDTRLMHLRVLDDEGSSNSFLLASAIHSAVDHGADIINVSVSTNFNSSMIEYAVARAKAAGVILIAAMGNDGAPTPSTTEYPAASPESYAVCATDYLDIKGSFSNWGACADFSVCGVSSLSATGDLDLTRSILGAVPGEGYAHWSGTSLSAALLSGAVALVRAQYPQWPNAAVPMGAVADTVMGLLAGSADNIDAFNPNYVGLIGVGRVNAGSAVLLGPTAPALADLDGNGRIDGGDLAMVLSSWGMCSADSNCLADFDGNGYVDGGDLAVIMANWG